jgi:hypothetical protein
MTDKGTKAISEDQEAIAKRAMELKAAAPGSSHPASEPTANKGMAPKPNTDMAPSGALNEEGQRPVLERSRKVR